MCRKLLTNTIINTAANIVFFAAVGETHNSGSRRNTPSGVFKIRIRQRRIPTIIVHLCQQPKSCNLSPVPAEHFVGSIKQYYVAGRSRGTHPVKWSTTRSSGTKIQTDTCLGYPQIVPTEQGPPAC